MKVYQVIAQVWQARENCEAALTREKGFCAGNEARNKEWHQRHGDLIVALCKEYLPSGSGFDRGTTLDFGASRPNRLVFNTSFHHMNDAGMYDGWTDHQVIVTPSLTHDFELRVTGRNRNDIKEYMADTFHDALSAEVKEGE